MKLLMISCFISASLWGQTVVATWTDTRNPAGSTTYNVYRSPPGTSVTITLTPTPIAALTYSDSVPGAGAYCYRVTAVVNGVESAPDIGCMTVAPFAPTGLSLTPVAINHAGTSGVIATASVRALSRAPTAKKAKQPQPPVNLAFTERL